MAQLLELASAVLGSGAGKTAVPRADALTVDLTEGVVRSAGRVIDAIRGTYRRNHELATWVSPGLFSTPHL